MKELIIGLIIGLGLGIALAPTPQIDRYTVSDEGLQIYYTDGTGYWIESEE